MDRGGIFYARPDGSSIREVAFPMLQPNGIGLSPQEDVLYVAETVTGRLWAFDLDDPGEIRRQSWPSPNGGRLVASLPGRSEEHTSELQSLMRISYAVFCLKKKKQFVTHQTRHN